MKVDQMEPSVECKEPAAWAYVWAFKAMFSALELQNRPIHLNVIKEA